MSKKITNTFENLLTKYKARDLPEVVYFLVRMKRKSTRTAFCYSFALDHLNNFIERNYNNNYNVQTILEPLQNNKIDACNLLNGFVSYLHNDTINGHDLSPKSVKLYMAAVRSYLACNDIEITPTRFKYKVTMPTVYREDEQAIDEKDIRQILLACNNRRLKTYLLVLASGGMRAVEALAIRLRDLDFSVKPTKVHIRKEYAKTRAARDVYISDEATQYLKQWIEWKYRDRHAENKNLENMIKSDDDLVFSKTRTSIPKNPQGLYTKVLLEFQKLLELARLNLRKEDGVNKKRKVTFHSFRRFVKSTISNEVSYDYSEWFLGHSTKSSYYTMKEEERRSIYATKLDKHFTYLDYSTLEAKGKGVESQLEEKDQEIRQLKDRDTANAERIARLEARLDQMVDWHNKAIASMKSIVDKAAEGEQKAGYLYTMSSSLSNLASKLKEITQKIEEYDGKETKEYKALVRQGTDLIEEYTQRIRQGETGSDQQFRDVTTTIESLSNLSNRLAGSEGKSTEAKGKERKGNSKE